MYILFFIFTPLFSFGTNQDTGNPLGGKIKFIEIFSKSSQRGGLLGPPERIRQISDIRIYASELRFRNKISAILFSKPFIQIKEGQKFHDGRIVFDIHLRNGSIHSYILTLTEIFKADNTEYRPISNEEYKQIINFCFKL